MKKTKPFYPLYIPVLLLALASCGGGSTASDSNNTASLDIEGTWTSDCYQQESNNKTTTVTVSGDQIDSGNQLYTDESCTDLQAMESGISGTYIIGNEIMTTGGVTAHEIDITFVTNDTEAVLLNIIKVDGDVMYLGQDASVTNRPQTLNFDKVYRRQ